MEPVQVGFIFIRVLPSPLIKFVKIDFHIYSGDFCMFVPMVDYSVQTCCTLNV